MELIDQIRKDWIHARKSYNVVEAKIIGYLYSEADTKRKNQGSITNNDVIATVKNLVAKAQELDKIVDNEDVKEEIRILSVYLPDMISEWQLKTDIASSLDEGLNIGQIMGRLKKTYGQTVDMKSASKLIKELSSAN